MTVGKLIWVTAEDVMLKIVPYEEDDGETTPLATVEKGVRIPLRTFTPPFTSRAVTGVVVLMPTNPFVLILRKLDVAPVVVLAVGVTCC